MVRRPLLVVVWRLMCVIACGRVNVVLLRIRTRVRCGSRCVRCVIGYGSRRLLMIVRLHRVSRLRCVCCRMLKLWIRGRILMYRCSVMFVLCRVGRRWCSGCVMLLCSRRMYDWPGLLR